MINSIIFLLIPFLITSCKTAIKNESKPNIVLILADDMGYECLGINGSTEYETPNLDRLATEGIRFENCYSQPLCTPSRVKIMTGKYNFRNYEDFGYLNPNEETFGNLLKEAGYATCIAGKWQLNGLNRNNPGNQDVTRPNHFGFDEYCLWQLNRSTAEGERYANPLIIQNGKELPRDPNAYGPQIMADYVIDFIDRNANKPFFIYYPMILPHSPFVPTPDSPEWKEPSMRFENDTAYFADMIAYLDKIIGKLQTKLKEKNIWKNTLFIFTADNGTHRAVYSSTISRKVKGAKGETINDGNHVPLIISWPENIKKGNIFKGIIDFADFLPTLTDVAGIEPSSYYTDGKSFMNILNGDNHLTEKVETFVHYTPRWGWPSANNQHNRWVMNGEYKLYRDGRFYNTVKDPLEKEKKTVLGKNEQKIKDKFEAILTEKENEFPFKWNDTEFNPAQ
ncbi:MAG: sulfatase-like hydrolase/transferase [Mariniphaga sp.]|jgi:arylsulfatase A|nr:sulfatase-like hydrolase/transferase [Mariniphaga sp.]